LIPPFVIFFSFEIEGYVAGFGNPDWKRTHAAASRTAVAVTNLLKQGATCVGRTVMDELGFGFVLSFLAQTESILLDWSDLLLFRIVGATLL
jgi:Asp-tRNA(Asn)/Glu-tRNA(Gln) amidotransferase A subunit family amidase